MVEITRCDVRIPNHIYEQIEALAVTNGASNHHRSNKPIVTPTILELLQIGLAHYDKPLSDKLPDTNLIDEKISAAIAPILSRLEALELKSDHAPVLPTPKTQDISRPEENAPQLPFVAANHDIPAISPLTLPCNADKTEVNDNLTEASQKPIADDLSKGLSQIELAKRYGLTRQAVNNQVCNGTIDQWLQKKGKDQWGILWEYDPLKDVFFPVTE